MVKKANNQRLTFKVKHIYFIMYPRYIFINISIRYRFELLRWHTIQQNK